MTRTDFDRRYHLEPLYIGETQRVPVWHSYHLTWVQMASIVAFLVLMVAAVLFAGGTFQLGAQ